MEFWHQGYPWVKKRAMILHRVDRVYLFPHILSNCMIYSGFYILM
ncbi:hypothetical protein [Citrobacter pasteurii]|nr:hypothetical protein [Citrobacter pasteurii]